MGSAHDPQIPGVDVAITPIRYLDNLRKLNARAISDPRRCLLGCAICGGRTGFFSGRAIGIVRIAQNLLFPRCDGAEIGGARELREARDGDGVALGGELADVAGSLERRALAFGVAPECRSREVIAEVPAAPRGVPAVEHDPAVEQPAEGLAGRAVATVQHVGERPHGVRNAGRHVLLREAEKVAA